MTNQWIAYTDGACRGNPGPSGCGVHLLLPGGDEARLKKYIGHATNNQAEYQAMILALRELVRRDAKDVCLRADSELMVKQMRGEYRVKNENIKPLYEEAKALVRTLSKIKFEHVRREYNTVADALANEAIDEKGKL